jgi:hypothetical protein
MLRAAVWHICSHFEALVTKWRKATVSFVMSVRPSVLSIARKEQLSCQWTDFHEI